MLKKLILLLLFAFFACENPKPAQKEPDYSKDTVYQFLSKPYLYQEPHKLLDRLDSADLNHRNVYEFCQKIPDYQRKMVLARAVAERMENYTNENNVEYWASILYDLERFGEYIEVVRSPDHRSFMDVGSANGEKLYAALCLGFEKVYGLEYAPELVEISHEFFRPYPQVEIRLGDALEVEGAYYAQADLIYMYSPIKDHEPMAKLYQKIMQNMKDGAVLVEVRMVYSEALRRLTRLDFPEMGGFFAIRRDGDQYEYLTYDSFRKNWHRLSTLPQSDK